MALISDNVLRYSCFMSLRSFTTVFLRCKSLAFFGVGES
jgi:hypothetical protein